MPFHFILDACVDGTGSQGTPPKHHECLSKLCSVGVDWTVLSDLLYGKNHSVYKNQSMLAWWTIKLSFSTFVSKPQWRSGCRLLENMQLHWTSRVWCSSWPALWPAVALLLVLHRPVSRSWVGRGGDCRAQGLPVFCRLIGFLEQDKT